MTIIIKSRLPQAQGRIDHRTNLKTIFFNIKKMNYIILIYLD